MEDQLFSSQNSDLNNQQLDEIEQKAHAKNTKRATEWGVKKFEKRCEKRRISVDLKTVSLKALANEDTLLRIHCCRHKCFPVCPRAQHLLRTQILCPQQMFPSLRSPRNIMGNNVSATMCPRLPGPVENTVVTQMFLRYSESQFSRLRHVPVR